MHKRGRKIDWNLVQGFGEKTMNTLTHAMVAHAHAHEQKHKTGITRSPTFDAYEQTDGSLYVYIRSLDVETAFEIDATGWRELSSDEANDDSSRLELRDEEGFKQALKQDRDDLKRASQALSELNAKATSAVMIFDHSMRSMRAVHNVLLRYPHMTEAANKVLATPIDGAYLVLYLSMEKCLVSGFPEEALQGDVEAIDVLMTVVSDLPRCLLKTETLPRELSSTLNMLWVAKGGLALVDG